MSSVTSEGRSTRKAGHRRPHSHDPIEGEAAANAALAEIGALPEDDARAAELREYVVMVYAPFVRRVALKYRGHGEPYEDVRQTAMVGLLKAVHGFDPDRGSPFVSYLLPTVLGEIKRHFRDHTWAMRVPRQHQENRARLRTAIGAFEQEHAREPTTREIGELLGMCEGEAAELLQADQAYRALSLDVPHSWSGDGSEGTSPEDRLGCEDRGLALVEERESLRPALARLPERERRLLTLRFFGDKSQSEIAAELGYSQMHVSRLLAAVLQQLREDVGACGPKAV
ncbi:SigB/SigF/SigG family RNA polymerase sigma factor [Nocardiopsis sp. NRRL B-16309]|uniref:SigB/SigF/SigG family RNA polymerase sigma factor n=1 Tax=Nocardiopsis sp. NRRL B-16309 TaxID=1519494 RepID=UPI0006AF6A07|nr:SigB/SigF/SigG family RNA polymerase sigma factor [Nocardiopsis sp. NRRL B-16309]